MPNKEKPSKISAPFKFINKWRSLPSYELICYILMYASIPMFAYGIKPYNFEIIKIVILTTLTMYSSFFAVLIWNDVTDADIDAIAHPDRPIPSGRINSKKFFMIALFFSALTFIFAYLISIWCLFIVCIAALYVTFHNKYFKRNVKLPAYSEIFGPIQWVVVIIFGFFTIWTSYPQSSDIMFSLPIFGHISTNIQAVEQMILLIFFMYFADSSHDVAEGIHDSYADNLHGVKTYATTFGIKNAARISLLLFIISGMFGIIIFLRSALSLLFLVFFLFIFIYTLFYPIKLVKSKKGEIEDLGLLVGRKLYDYFLFSFGIIFLDLLIQLFIKFNW